MPCSRDPIMGQLLLLRWSQDQVEGAQQALSATAYALRKLKKDAQKTRQVRKLHIQRRRKELQQYTETANWLLMIGDNALSVRLTEVKQLIVSSSPTAECHLVSTGQACNLQICAGSRWSNLVPLSWEEAFCRACFGNHSPGQP